MSERQPGNRSRRASLESRLQAESDRRGEKEGLLWKGRSTPGVELGERELNTNPDFYTVGRVESGGCEFNRQGEGGDWGGVDVSRAEKWANGSFRRDESIFASF